MKKIFTLIQGPTTHVKEIIEHYSHIAALNWNNVIWVTQDRKDDGNVNDLSLKTIEQSNIKLFDLQGY